MRFRAPKTTPSSFLTSASGTWTSRVSLLANTSDPNIGIEELGIYRLSGSLSQVKQLEKMYELGQDVDFFEMRVDTNAVASLFKLWVRERMLFLTWLIFDSGRVRLDSEAASEVQ
jgi:hypothetical protein